MLNLSLAVFKFYVFLIKIEHLVVYKKRRLMIFNNKFSGKMVDEKFALKGRDNSVTVSKNHLVFEDEINSDFGEYSETICLGAGCFWGVEKKFWQTDGVLSTSVGYAGGFTKNPTYEEVCSGATGHAEVVLVTYNKTLVNVNEIMKIFWEMHDPTQGYKQGNDMGTQYRSAIYFVEKDHGPFLVKSKNSYQTTLSSAGMGFITTEIKPMECFYFAEDYHQQYLVKNPNGYCALRGTGIEYIDCLI